MAAPVTYDKKSEFQFFSSTYVHEFRHIYLLHRHMYMYTEQHCRGKERTRYILAAAAGGARGNPNWGWEFLHALPDGGDYQGYSQGWPRCLVAA